MASPIKLSMHSFLFSSNFRRVFSSLVLKGRQNKSPLRYPGGKTRACVILDQVFRNHFDPSLFQTILSPFFGGGSFEFFLQKQYGYGILANDKFTPLYSFWQTCKDKKEELSARLEASMSVSKEDFAQYRKCIRTITDPLEQAVFYFLVNRCSFSGATLSGGFSKEASKKRLTSSSIQKIKSLDLSDIDFLNMDANEMMEQYLTSEKQFLFLDPPYHLEKKSTLYGWSGDLHEQFDHLKLYKTIRYRKNWMLTYNNCKWIKELYKEFPIIEVDWKYGMSKSKASSEIVIISK
jgi:DNA adenine methylase